MFECHESILETPSENFRPTEMGEANLEELIDE